MTLPILRALGFMYPLWMVLVAVLIAIAKMLPWRRAATYAVTGVLVMLGILVIVAPDIVAGFPMPM